MSLNYNAPKDASFNSIMRYLETYIVPELKEIKRLLAEQKIDERALEEKINRMVSTSLQMRKEMNTALTEMKEVKNEKTTTSKARNKQSS